MRAVQTKPLNHARLLLEILPSQIGFPFLLSFFPSFLPSFLIAATVLLYFFSFLFSFQRGNARHASRNFFFRDSLPPLRKKEHGSLPANEAANAARAFYRRGRNVAALWKNVGKNTRGSINEKYDSLYLYSSPSLPPSPSPFFSPTPFPLPGNF